jgi:hypothetical protein
MAVTISRAVEYALPCTLLYITVALARSGPGLLKQTEEVLTEAAQRISKIFRVLLVLTGQVKRLSQRTMLLTFLTALYGITLLSLDAVNMDRYHPKYHTIKGAAEVIRKNSQDGEIVFFLDFSDYPGLVFFNNQNRYITGMGSIFTYTHAAHTYWLWHHVVIGDKKICSQRTCEQGTHDIYDVIHGEFNAAFVFLDYRDGDNPLIEKIREDARFTELFRADDQAKIVVYKVNES